MLLLPLLLVLPQTAHGSVATAATPGTTSKPSSPRSAVSRGEPTHQHSHCTLRPPSNIHRPPLIIGHRGAPYHLPEHTLPSYRLALELGADYIGTDLVPTKDGHLIALHSLDLNITTDVATKFPKRHRRHNKDDDVDWVGSGYFAHDFTLKQLQSLRVKQRDEDQGVRYGIYDGLFGIPTFTELLDLLYEWNTQIRHQIGTDDETAKTRGRVGLYVEIKDPNFLRDDANISISDMFLKELRDYPHGYDMFFNETECMTTLKFDEYQVPPLVIECFDSDTLTYLRTQYESTGVQKEMVPPMVKLVNKNDCQKDEFWYEVRERQFNGVGPSKECLLRDGLGEGRDFMLTAREHEVAVHPWTERMDIKEMKERGTDEEGEKEKTFVSSEEELRYLFCDLGVDGVFAENVGTAVKVASMGCPSEKEREKNGGASSSSGGVPCYDSDTEEMTFVGLAFGFMGLFIGVLMTYWITSSKRKRMRQLAVPTTNLDEDNLEML